MRNTLRSPSSRRTAAILTAALALCLSGAAFSESPPPSTKDRLWMSANYLEHPEEGLYELQYNAPTGLVFASVMDRVRRDDNLGYLYAFDGKTLDIKGRYAMPYRAFSLTQDAKGQWLYVGHTQAASLRISKVDPKTGKVALTSERLHVDPSEPQHEHLRHVVHSAQTGELFTAYIGSVKENDKYRSFYKLLILDGETLKMKGEVESAFPSVGYALHLDRGTGHIFTAGSDYINEIDPVTRRVVHTIRLDDKIKPRVNNLVGLAVDARGGRIFASQFIHQPRPDAKDEQDGLYVFDRNNGKQLAFVPTGKGGVTLSYSPKHNEIYVSNFRSGTISVVDGKTYQITRQIPAHVFPNMMALAADESALYVGLKQGFSKQWNPDEFVEGAKEQILRVTLDRDAP